MNWSTAPGLQHELNYWRQKMGNREKSGKEELIKMGIAVDYPVLWSFERTLRDLIQNFYDSIGPEKFGKEMEYTYRWEPAGTLELIMKTMNRPFHYEWLIYIGGSTKTEAGSGYIGKYGEGFKICMLNLLKAGISDVEMHSQDWTLSPCIYEEIIDGTNVAMMGYMCSRCKDDNITSLQIRGIPHAFIHWIQEGLLHFFYPENPLFGERIGENMCGDNESGTNRTYTVYSGSRMKVPCLQRNCRGILYINHLARGRLPFPAFIDMSGEGLYIPDNRKRNNLNIHQVWESMYILARRMKPEDSLRLLLLMEPYWNDIPRSRNDNSTWYYVICQLVRNTASKESTTAKFKESYNHLAYIERKSSDRKRNSLIDRTTLWAAKNNTDRIVNPVFRLLGAKSLIQQYIDTSMTGKRSPTKTEKEMIDLLINLYQRIIPQKMQIPVPEIWIDENGIIDPDPLYFADRATPSRDRDRHQKYIIRHIILSGNDLAPEAFEATLIKIMDTMLHVYGSSRSNRLNLIFTDLGALLISNIEIIMKEKNKWIKLATDPVEPG